MRLEHYFVALVVVLEYGAGIAYMWHNDWRQALMWAAFATGGLAAANW